MQLRRVTDLSFDKFSKSRRSLKEDKYRWCQKPIRVDPPVKTSTVQDSHTTTDGDRPEFRQIQEIQRILERKQVSLGKITDDFDDNLQVGLVQIRKIPTKSKVSTKKSDGYRRIFDEKKNAELTKRQVCSSFLEFWKVAYVLLLISGLRELIGLEHRWLALNLYSRQRSELPRRCPILSDFVNRYELFGWK